MDDSETSSSDLVEGKLELESLVVSSRKDLSPVSLINETNASPCRIETHPPPPLSPPLRLDITEINITKRELRSQGVGKAALNLFKAFLLDAESGDRVWNQELNPVEFLLCWPVTLTSELERSDSPLQSFFSDPAPAPDPVREATRRRNLERVLSFFHDVRLSFPFLAPRLRADSRLAFLFF